MSIQKILFGVTGGWFVLSLGAIAYAALLAPAQTVHPTQVAGALPNRAIVQQVAVEQPPDFPPELNPETAAKDAQLSKLLYRYFPQPLSQHLEEAFIRDYFQDMKGGFLLDVGASHYKIRSNTYYLDIALGWSGIAVDAIAELGPDYAKHRPRTKFFGMFVSDKSDEDVDFFVVQQNSRLSTADVKAAEAGGQHETRKLKTATLNALLESQGVKKVNLMNMDIEMWEPKALAGFDVDKYKPDLVCIEMHGPVKQQIYDYFGKHNYVAIDPYTKWDGTNAYFIPKEDLPKFLARKDADGLPAQEAKPPAVATGATDEHDHDHAHN